VKVFVLHVVALVAALAAARFLHREQQIETSQSALVAAPIHLPPVTERVVAWSSGVIGLGAAVGVTWLTIAGLRVGFL
jgi:hypothetical protein